MCRVLMSYSARELFISRQLSLFSWGYALQKAYSSLIFFSIGGLFSVIINHDAGLKPALFWTPFETGDFSVPFSEPMTQTPLVRGAGRASLAETVAAFAGSDAPSAGPVRTRESAPAAARRWAGLCALKSEMRALGLHLDVDAEMTAGRTAEAIRAHTLSGLAASAAAAARIKGTRHA